MVCAKSLIHLNTSGSECVAESSTLASSVAPIYLQSDDHRGWELANTLQLKPRDLESAPQSEWYLGFVRGELALCHRAEPPLVISERSVRNKIDDARHSALARVCVAAQGRTVLDAFGGWGIDGFALSALGCEVTILEANPIVCSVARFVGMELGSTAKVICTNAEHYLKPVQQQFEVIYFDPMFPPHPKKARPVRRMQVLEQLAWRGTDFEGVFNLAKDRATDRIVVKARRTSPSSMSNPDWKVSGRTVRFDVYRVG